jgi:uncharacterized membrane protein
VSHIDDHVDDVRLEGLVLGWQGLRVAQMRPVEDVTTMANACRIKRIKIGKAVSMAPGWSRRDASWVRCIS